jgi:hypothetical protein
LRCGIPPFRLGKMPQRSEGRPQGRPFALTERAAGLAGG